MLFVMIVFLVQLEVQLQVYVNVQNDVNVVEVWNNMKYYLNVYNNIYQK